MTPQQAPSVHFQFLPIGRQSLPLVQDVKPLQKAFWTHFAFRSDWQTPSLNFRRQRHWPPLPEGVQSVGGQVPHACAPEHLAASASRTPTLASIVASAPALTYLKASRRVIVVAKAFAILSKVSPMLAVHFMWLSP
jgi:hypothetical protein